MSAAPPHRTAVRPTHAGVAAPTDQSCLGTFLAVTSDETRMKAMKTMTTMTTVRVAMLCAIGTLLLARWRASRRFHVSGKVVMITGGSRGLGLVLAREFAREGAKLVICARDETELQRARRALAEQGADVVALPCDVSRLEQIEAVVRTAVERFGGIDVLVNNASIMQAGPFEAMDIRDLRRAMEVNFWGTVNATTAVLPNMREHGEGAIVNVTSIGAVLALPHVLPYTCSKFAARGFSEGLRAELGRAGISVTTVIPWLMRTGSPVNAWFKGNAEHEYLWFSFADAIPFATVSARYAARRIVAATKRREVEVVIGWPARVLKRVHDLFPGLTIRLFALMNRALPRAPEQESGEKRGMQLASLLSPSPLTALLNRAARRLNQYGGQARPSPQHAHRVGLEGGTPRPRI